MKGNGRSNSFVVGVWSATGLVLAASVVVGNVAFATTAGFLLTFVLS